MRFALHGCAALFMLSVLPFACGEALQWQVARPRAGVPLVTARVPGQVHSGHRWGDALLELACRTDAPPAVLTVELPAVRALGFDLAPFAASAAGTGRAGRARLYLGRDRGLAVVAGGRFVAPDRFRLTVPLPASQARQLLQVPQLRLSLFGGPSQHGRFDAVFALPEDEQPLKAVLAGCEA